MTQETDEIEHASRTLQEELAAARELIIQLETALTSRVRIEQAKGVLAERFALDIDAAFSLLRSGARSSQTNLHILAERVVQEQPTPGPITAALARESRLRGAAMRERTELIRERARRMRERVERSIHELEKSSAWHERNGREGRPAQTERPVIPARSLLD